MGEHNEAPNLTGVWNGLYTYSSGLSVNFVATLIDSGRSLSGSTYEPNVMGPSGMLYANVAGGRQESSVAFMKTYDDAGPRYHYPVSYEGALNGDATEIEGLWRIGDGSSGKFMMIRGGGKAATIERKKAVKV